MRLALPSLCHGLPARRAIGVGALDTVLGGGLVIGAVHEFHAAAPEDAPAAAGLALGMATGIAAERTMLWLRSRRAVRAGGVLQAPGWAELGVRPGAWLLGQVDDDKALLRAAVEALRCAALGAVVVEGRGALRDLDLTASRRLALAAEKSGVTLFLLRLDSQPAPSAAQTRWRVAAAPSRALPGRAPGAPAYDIELLRQKGGPGGLHWRLEWDRDQCLFREAPPSGDVVPVPVRGPITATGTRNAA